MFELDDSIRDELAFAMENQDIEYMIVAETGALVTMGDDASALDEVADMIAPPEWTSADGYALMESFTAGVGDIEARSGLAAALSRGRGVFRAFKQTLEMFSDVERKWFEYKHNALRRRINEWYDDARIARGLERLGPEPEETDELLTDDFTFRLANRDCWPECVPLFRRGLDEALSQFPEPLVEYEYTSMEREISEGGRDGLVLAIVEAAGGAIVGVAAARRVFVADSSFGKLAYLYVAPEHRRLGLGVRLAEYARERLVRDGILRFVIDMPFIPVGFGAALAAHGYEAFGTRYLRSDD